MPDNPTPPPRPRRSGAQSGCRPGAQSGRRRRRGGQPGNTNALKHGFYARHLPLEDTAGLDDLPLDTLADEITLLRILIRRVAEKSAAGETPEKSIEHLRVVGLAMFSLTRLMRTQIYMRANRPVKIPLEYLQPDLDPDLQSDLQPDLYPTASVPRGAAAPAPRGAPDPAPAEEEDLPEEPYPPLF
jgi:hypothetical protein